MDARQSLFLGEDSTHCAERLVAEGNGPGATFTIPVSAGGGSAGAAGIDGGSGAFSYTVSQVPISILTVTIALVQLLQALTEGVLIWTQAHSTQQTGLCSCLRARSSALQVGLWPPDLIV